MDGLLGLLLAFGITYVFLYFRYGDKFSIKWQKLAGVITVFVAAFAIIATAWSTLTAALTGVVIYYAVRAL